MNVHDSAFYYLNNDTKVINLCLVSIIKNLCDILFIFMCDNNYDEDKRAPNQGLLVFDCSNRAV